MCGIAGFNLAEQDQALLNSPAMIKALGLEIMSRGGDATGVLTVTDNMRPKVRKAQGDAKRFFGARPQLGSRAAMSLIHTRAYTQGHPSDQRNNHPIVYDNVIGTHNGMIYNDYVLFKENSWMRYAGVNGVDSEAIFAALHHKPTAKEALEMIEGWLAIAWVHTQDPGRLWLAKGHQSPLWLATTENGSLFYASTEKALDNLSDQALVAYKHEPWEIMKEGYIIGYDPNAEANTLFEDEFTPPSYTKIYGSFSNSGWEHYVSRAKSGMSWDIDEGAFAGPDKYKPTLALTVDSSIDPFDDEQLWEDQTALHRDGGGRSTFYATGERVIDKRGRIGTVVHCSIADGQAAIEWDPSIEEFDDLWVATSTDEDDTLNEYANFMRPMAAARKGE